MRSKCSRGIWRLPLAGASAEQALPLIQAQASGWATMHLFMALASIVLAAACLAVLSARTSLTVSSFGLAGWSLLAVLNVLLAVLVVMKGTAQGDAATAGDMQTFAVTYRVSLGFEFALFALYPLAFATLVLHDLYSRAPLEATRKARSALRGRSQSRC